MEPRVILRRSSFSSRKPYGLLPKSQIPDFFVKKANLLWNIKYYCSFALY